MSAVDTIYNVSVSNGVPKRVAKYLVSMAAHETGDFSHRFFTVGNNAFGYSYNPSSKWQLNKGGDKADNGVSIAQYSNVENSTREVLDWIKKRQSSGVFPKNLEDIDNIDEFAQYLKKGGYFQADTQSYANGVRRYYNDLPERIGISSFSTIMYIAATILTIYYINGRQF